MLWHTCLHKKLAILAKMLIQCGKITVRIIRTFLHSLSAAGGNGFEDGSTHLLEQHGKIFYREGAQIRPSPGDEGGEHFMHTQFMIHIPDTPAGIEFTHITVCLLYTS